MPAAIGAAGMAATGVAAGVAIGDITTTDIIPDGVAAVTIQVGVVEAGTATAVYTNRRSSGRSEYSNGIRRQEGSSIRGEGSSTRRVVGTRTSTGTRSYDRSNSIRVEGTSSRRK